MSGADYVLLQTSGGTFAINSNTGVLTTGGTAAGTYTLYIRNNGSYNITEYQLTLVGGGNSEIPCCLRPVDTYGADNQTQTEVKGGLAMIVNFPARRGPISHSDLLRIKKAYAFKR